jgi:hypothetical protein
MKVYLAYSENYRESLQRVGAKLIISYGRQHGSHLEPTLPETFPSYLIDSGGYQLKMGTAERGIYIGGYCLYLKFILQKYGPKIDGYFGLDTADEAETLRNIDYMVGKGLKPIPVWKLQWSEEGLRDYCSAFDYVAIGGLVGAGTRSRTFYRMTFERIKQHHPTTKFHTLGIGITAMTAFKAVRPFSIDLSTWGTAARFGNRLIYDKKLGIKEIKLPDIERQRLRDDNAYETELVEEAIGLVMGMEDAVELQHDNMQQILF